MRCVLCVLFLRCSALGWREINLFDIMIKNRKSEKHVHIELKQMLSFFSLSFWHNVSQADAHEIEKRNIKGANYSAHKICSNEERKRNERRKKMATQQKSV